LPLKLVISDIEQNARRSFWVEDRAL
jgi:hypothetical protein